MIIFAIQFLHLLCSEFVLRQTQSNTAGVVKLVDTLDLGSSASRCEGSSPFARTKKKLLIVEKLFYFMNINDTILAGDPSAIWPACLPARQVH